MDLIQGINKVRKITTFINSSLFKYVKILFCTSLLWILTQYPNTPNINFSIHARFFSSLIYLIPAMVQIVAYFLRDTSNKRYQWRSLTAMPSEVPLSTSLKLSKASLWKNFQHISAQITLTHREVLSMTLVHLVLAMGHLGQAASNTKWEEKAIVCWAFENAKESKPPNS